MTSALSVKLRPLEREDLRFVHQLDNNASVNKASAQMFIHRNTINYKIKKIEHILSCDLSSFEERFTLMLAIKLLEMYA